MSQPGQQPVQDALGRTLGNLRLSVTDRCNLRCAYCMPEEDYTWLPHDRLLRFEEISLVVDAFARLGVRKVRLTGGEPLVRRDLPVLVEMLAEKPELEDIALTTNGVLLAPQAPLLKRAGLHRVTVSLDTLRPERFRALTRRDDLPKVLDGIAAAANADLLPLKIDAVVIRGTNEDELEDLLEFARGAKAEIRFIEYMDVGGATRWSPQQVFSRAEILERLTRRYGPIAAAEPQGSAPAERFRLPDGTTFGIIASTTAPFCRTCDRSRVTADGTWYLCLYAATGIDLRKEVRAGATAEELALRIRSVWEQRRLKGAEERLAERDRRALFQASELKDDPRLEMHTRGG